jgi:hypothetical protein
MVEEIRRSTLRKIISHARFSASEGFFNTLVAYFQQEETFWTSVEQRDLLSERGFVKEV